MQTDIRRAVAAYTALFEIGVEDTEETVRPTIEPMIAALTSAMDNVNPSFTDDTMVELDFTDEQLDQIGKMTNIELRLDRPQIINVPLPYVKPFCNDYTATHSFHTFDEYGNAIVEQVSSTGSLDDCSTWMNQELLRPGGASGSTICMVLIRNKVSLL